MVIVLIRTRVRPDCDPKQVETLEAQMAELVQRVPGFIAAESAGDVGIIRFESLAALRAWRDHPEHVVAQRRGRAELYASYSVEICELVRAYAYDASSGEPSELPAR